MTKAFKTIQEAKGGGYKIKFVSCIQSSGEKSYQTKIYKGNKLVNVTEAIESYREAFVAFTEMCEEYGVDWETSLSGVSDAQLEQYQKEVASYYRPYSWSTADKIYLPDTNLVAGKVKRIAAHLSTEQTKLLLDFLRAKEKELYDRYKKHIFTDRHSVWKMVDYTAEVEQANSERASREDVTLELTNCNVELSYTDDRLRIIFDSMPSAEQRNALKHGGFRWSPSNSAWQRQLTDNAIRSVVNDYSRQYDSWLPLEDREKIKKAYYEPGYKQEQEQELNDKKHNLLPVVSRLSQGFENGESFDWRDAQKIANEKQLKCTQQELMQACELAVVLQSRRIAHNGASLAERFAALRDLYEQQVTIRPLDTQSKYLQQYSTPCPLAFLLGEYVKKGQPQNAIYLEPTAGNGMLTVALDASKVTVNELDEIRYNNLLLQSYNVVLNEDANNLALRDKHFSGIITNPPFAKLPDGEVVTRNGWTLAALDYKLSALALDKMQDNGRAAIIVGGKMWGAYWEYLTRDKKVLFGKWKLFLGYLYAQYNVEDVVYINGENIYYKQGTQFPIVVILINGRREYNEDNKPRYVFDPDADTIINNFDELYSRISPYIIDEQPTPPADDDKARKRKLLILAQAKIKIAKAKASLNGIDTIDGIDEDFADKMNEFILNGYKFSDRSEYFSCGYPQKVLQLCDLDADIEIVITQDGMRKILGQKKGKQDNAHDLTPIEILRLPQLLREPILVINGNTSDSRLVFIEIPRASRKVFAVISVDKFLRLKNDRIYNLVASVYSQNDNKICTKIEQSIATNNVWYYDSRKIKNWLSVVGGLQLSSSLKANSLFSDKDAELDAKINK